jgi:PPOX class probable F420-dependent enzyme
VATEVPTSVFTAPVRAFLTDNPRYATIATLNPDGSPHQSIVWFLLRGDEIVVNSRIGRRWPANLRRDSRISFAVEAGEDAVTLAGTAIVSALDTEAQADITEMAWRYDDPEMAAREVARFQTEERISFLVRPTRVHVHGDPR